MREERRTAAYDQTLGLEAYRFTGIEQPFPNHFHTYYVVGLIESGRRSLSCRGAVYTISPGEMVLFNPGDNHACEQCGGDTLDYRGLTVTEEVMRGLAEEITGQPVTPRFAPTVIRDEEAACHMRSLHELVLQGECSFEREECLLLLFSVLLQRYGQAAGSENTTLCREEVERVCRFMEAHYDQHICLDQLCRCAGLSKAALVRAFAKAKGVTPYRYLENIRIDAAKKLLEQGVTPVEAALRTGFSDQSHFTNYFRQFIGLAPGVYREIFDTQH